MENLTRLFEIIALGAGIAVLALGYVMFLGGDIGFETFAEMLLWAPAGVVAALFLCLILTARNATTLRYRLGDHHFQAFLVAAASLGTTIAVFG